MRLVPLLFLLTTLICSQPSRAERIIVRVLDGKSGQRLPNLLVTIFGGAFGGLPVTPVGDSYEVDAGNAQQLQLGAIRHRANQLTEYSLCSYRKDLEFLPEVKEITDKGVVSHNSCSNRKETVTPGVLIIFVRKTHWWEKLD